MLSVYLGHQDAVGRLDGDGMPLHGKVFFVVMNLENRDRVALVVQGHNVPVVREEIDGLRVVAADGKDADLLQQSGLR